MNRKTRLRFKTLTNRKPYLPFDQNFYIWSKKRMTKIVECVPNFSEGCNQVVINKIADAIRSVEGARLLDVDPGRATNRTVMTIAGSPEAVLEAAFQGIATAADLIDMSRHEGEHPRFGACDVCPFIPIADATMDDCIKLAHRLGERLGSELGLSGYYYENAASRPERRNLSTVRAGEYEGLPMKIIRPEWQPDFGPAIFNERYGVTAIGARDFLVAYNVNLNTTSTRRANAVAFDVREAGRIMREGHPVTGEIVRDETGKPRRVPGKLKAVKAIGWYIEEYGIAQISMNLTNVSITSIYEAYEAVRESANERGLRVTGSELVGLIPKRELLEAGRYFLRLQGRSLGVPESELIKIAVKSMGLDELAPFDPKQKIIEYALEGDEQRLIDLDLRTFAEETASESPAPGGGSIAAYVGALGASLAAMVANLSAHKRGWDDKWAYYSEWAERGQQLSERLLKLVDADTAAFNGIMDAMRLPKETDEEKFSRKAALEAATKHAIDTPFSVMEAALEAMDVCEEMAKTGLVASVSDAGVGALCARAAVLGAYLNVQINCGGLSDEAFKNDRLSRGAELVERAKVREVEVLEIVVSKV